MSRLQRTLKGINTVFLFALLAACSGGGGGEFITSERVQRADSQTQFDVTVDSGSNIAQLNSKPESMLAKLQHLLLPKAWAAPVPGAEILIAYIDEKGLVLDILSAEDGLLVNDNGDGTYTVVMPDDPRVDGMIISNIAPGFDIKRGHTLPDGSFYAPTVGETVELSPEATAATRVTLNYINNFDAVTNSMMENMVANLTQAAADLVKQGQSDDLVADLDASYGNYVINTLLQAQNLAIADVSGYGGEYFLFSEYDVMLSNSSAYLQFQLQDLGLASLSVSPALNDSQGNLLPVNAGALSFQNRLSETSQFADRIDYAQTWTRSSPAASWTAISSNHNSVRESGQINLKLPQQTFTVGGQNLVLPAMELSAYGSAATTGAIIGHARSLKNEASFASAANARGYSNISPWLMVARGNAMQTDQINGVYGAMFSYSQPQTGETQRYTRGIQRFNATAGSFTSLATFNASTNSLANSGAVSSLVQKEDLGSFSFTAQANGVLSGGYESNAVSVSAPDGKFIYSRFGLINQPGKKGHLSLVKLAQGDATNPLTFNTVANKTYALIGHQYVMQNNLMQAGNFSGAITFTDAENTSFLSSQSQTSTFGFDELLAGQAPAAVDNRLVVSSDFLSNTLVTNTGEISFNVGDRRYRGFIQEGANLLLLHSFSSTTDEGQARYDDVTTYAVCVKGCTTVAAGRTFNLSANISGASGDVQVRVNQAAVETISSGTTIFNSTVTLPYASQYQLTVTAAPAGQVCEVTNASGVALANVSNISINCRNVYTVSGSATGVTSPVSLALNGEFETLAVAADGAFSFSNALVQGSNYTVTVQTQPQGRICSLSNAQGATISANVTNVALSCSAAFTLGGTITGLNGQLGLSVNGGTVQTLASTGEYTLSQTVASGGAYTVAITAQPTGQSCALSNASGTASANVTNINISCVATPAPTTPAPAE